MHIARSGRFVFVAQWVTIVLLPVFFFLGRGLVGAELGWLAVLGVVYGLVDDHRARAAAGHDAVRPDGAPRQGDPVRVRHLELRAVGRLPPRRAHRPRSRRQRATSTPALTAWTGGAITQETSEAIFTVAAAVIGLAYLATLVFAIIGIARWRRPFDA